jgi:hypothetical protein
MSQIIVTMIMLFAIAVVSAGISAFLGSTGDNRRKFRKQISKESLPRPGTTRDLVALHKQDHKQDPAW